MMDKFGTIMVQNFRSRGCNLPGLSACQSLLDQERRFHETGWKRTAAWTVNQVYQAFSQATRQRIERVEMLDDVEISQQLFDHYCILYAATDEAQFSWSDLSEPLAQIS
ncbi:Leucine carboxyl methyltransferase 1 [Fasciola hepatica]|uniref:Leucine carboxyl methyltransferase 1 n=1 Tax=Fasciola hepatica TaxID=6192 RepID=A0A4E0R3T7_FASHE|nr:Leucine carboxyl methyltransferase 1 [Fasciola hepatica]